MTVSNNKSNNTQTKRLKCVSKKATIIVQLIKEGIKWDAIIPSVPKEKHETLNT